MASKSVQTYQSNKLVLRSTAGDPSEFEVEILGTLLGYAKLDINGNIDPSQIGDAFLGQVVYQGTWNAATNTPFLPSVPTDKGHYYVTSVAGTQFGITFDVGDWIISNGIEWQKVDNTDSVMTVAGRTGNIILTKNDVGLSNVANVDTTNANNLSSGSVPNARISQSSVTQHQAALSVSYSQLTNVPPFSTTVNVETEISKSVPVGSVGQLPFIKIEGTRETEQDYMVTTGQFITSDSELTAAQTRIVTAQEIFDSWYRFSHTSSETQPAVPAELLSWSYDSVTDKISSTTNTVSVIGFVSNLKYSSYDTTVRLQSTDTDDDAIGLLLAFDTDTSTGREYTLTAVRTTGGLGYTWAVIYNMGRSDAWVVVNSSINVLWGNGGSGATAGAAGYSGGPTTGWSSFPTGTLVNANRLNDIFTVSTTNLGSDTTLPASTIVIDLTSDSRLARFRGPKSHGFIAQSQAQATFDVLEFSDPTNIIYDMRNDTAFEYNNSTDTWELNVNRSAITDVGIGRMAFDIYTKKQFYIAPDNVIVELSSGSQYLPLAGGNMTGSISYSNISASWARGLEGVASNAVTSGIGFYGVNDTVSFAYLAYGATPSDRLTSKGVYVSSSGTEVAGNLTVNGNILGTSYDTSTIRVKTDVVDLTDAYTDLCSLLRPVTYTSTISGKKEIGLIAEEVYSVYPELVLVDAEGNAEGIMYSRLVAVLINKMKILENKIISLKNTK